MEDKASAVSPVIRYVPLHNDYNQLYIYIYIYIYMYIDMVYIYTKKETFKIFFHDICMNFLMKLWVGDYLIGWH